MNNPKEIHEQAAKIIKERLCRPSMNFIVALVVKNHQITPHRVQSPLINQIMSTNTTPSAGAFRAAERIHSALLKAKALNGFDSSLTFDILASMAEIIDRETGAGRLAEALEKITAARYRITESIPETHEECIEIARAALVAWKENNQSTKD